MADHRDQQDDGRIRTGLWEGEKHGWRGTIEILKPGKYYVDLYTNERKTQLKHPDMNLILKPIGERRPTSASERGVRDARDSLGSSNRRSEAGNQYAERNESPARRPAPPSSDFADDDIPF